MMLKSAHIDSFFGRIKIGAGQVFRVICLEFCPEEKAKATQGYLAFRIFDEHVETMIMTVPERSLKMS